MNGLLLAIQFFTSVPIRKELPMERKSVTAMYIALPFIGGLIGLAMYGVAMLFTDGIGTGSLLASVFVVVAGIVLTGGLHMDGFADTGDAFFSYRDKEKRLEILDDPRLGAFGTMAVILVDHRENRVARRIDSSQHRAAPVLHCRPVSSPGRHECLFFINAPGEGKRHCSFLQREARSGNA